MKRTPLVVLVAVAAMALVAGCLQPPAGPGGPAQSPVTVEPTAMPPAGGGSEEPGPGQGSAPGPAPPTVEAKSFCPSEAQCDFWDDQFHEYVLYRVDTYVVDVLIVPPASPFAARDTATMKRVVEAWGEGIQALGQDWFVSNFKLNVYVVGTDTIPEEALKDPEIVVVGAEYNPVLLFGIGYQLPEVCLNRGGALATYPDHEHDGMTILAAECKQGGLTCVALNTNFLLGGERRMYDLVAHEFGHCLGIGHVGDALDFKAKTVPVQDIMSYQYDEKQVHCVSTLNVRVLEGVYAPLLDRPRGEHLLAGSFFSMNPAEYAQVPCQNPEP
ncbi:MAG TPA: hypothetical protein VNZ52_16730 [Candidatus Thermoplasmatota archaeon]|nr:hypothetical protein [Candidatus Thermoplasmatota archaeon]